MGIGLESMADLSFDYSRSSCRTQRQHVKQGTFSDSLRGGTRMSIFLRGPQIWDGRNSHVAPSVSPSQIALQYLGSPPSSRLRESSNSSLLGPRRIVGVLFHGVYVLKTDSARQ